MLIQRLVKFLNSLVLAAERLRLFIRIHRVEKMKILNTNKVKRFEKELSFICPECLNKIILEYPKEEEDFTLNCPYCKIFIDFHFTNS